MMKSTGIVRRLDELGRITIPKEMRRTMDIKEGDPVEMFVDNGMICLQKYQEQKCSCGETDRKLLREWNDRYICTRCITKLIDKLDEDVEQQ